MEALLANLHVVLVRPRFPENIGAAARAIANLGLGGLRVVAPARLWAEPMRRLATERGEPVLAAMGEFASLEAALADCVGAAATTARQGARRGDLLAPRAALPRVLAWAREGRAALVFGPEDKGLETQELDRCQLTISIPTTESYSLNLAQAVVVLAYEARTAALAGEDPAAPEAPRRSRAPLGAVLGLYHHLTEALVALGVILPSNPEHFFRPFKQALDRAELSPREVRALHGVARQALWLSRELEAATGRPTPVPAPPRPPAGQP